MVRARKARGWSQTELAQAAQVGLSTVTRAETAKRTPRTHEAQRMAEQLGLTLEALLAVSELVEQPAPTSPTSRTKKSHSSKPAKRRKPARSRSAKAPGPKKARAQADQAEVEQPQGETRAA